MRNKILSLLVLLLTAATGAWAQGLYNVFEVTQDMVASWTNDKTAVSAADLPTFGAVTEDEAKAWTGAPATGLSYLIYDFNGENTKYVQFTDGKRSSVGEYNWKRSEMQGDISDGIKIFYTGLFVIPGATAGTWTFTMPGSDVMLTPVYAPVAKWAVSSEVDQIPTAIDGIFAGEAKDIVKAGTVAKVGSTENAQGTVMYLVTTTNEQPTSTTGFSATVPTGAVLTGSYTENQTVYVWYYIAGIDAAEGVTPTAENTFNDSEICTTPLKVTVLSDKFDIRFKAANANTIQAGKATVKVGETAAEVTEGKLEGVKMGSEVKVTAKEGYKFRKVEVKKRPEFVPGATIQNIESFVEVENNRDGTITLHMPTLKPSTYNVTNSTLSNVEHTLHFGYEIGSGTDMTVIGKNITAVSWSAHTPFSELDKTIDITSGMPRVAIIITGHVQSATCPAPGSEYYWGLYRYTNPVKVTYNLGGGSVSGSTADKVEYLFSGDALATTFAAPTREGYTFDGWYTSAEGGTKLTASNATSATTIYAHWNAIAE